MMVLDTHGRHLGDLGMTVPAGLRLTLFTRAGGPFTGETGRGNGVTVDVWRLEGGEVVAVTYAYNLPSLLDVAGFAPAPGAAGRGEVAP